MANYVFIFRELMQTVALAFVGLLAVKAVGGLRAGGAQTGTTRLKAVTIVLYASILALVILGARTLGNDVAAEAYFQASTKDLQQSRVGRAYENAHRAVELRPGVLRYWQALGGAKLAQHQFQSLVDDEQAFRMLAGGYLQEADAVRFALAHQLLAQYDEVISITRELIQNNRFFPWPYVIQGDAYIALKKNAEAEKTFLTVLQMFPSEAEAVEGLAHVYFLNGQPARAIAVLNQTAQHPFPPEARQRFEELKALYAQ